MAFWLFSGQCAQDVCFSRVTQNGKQGFDHDDVIRWLPTMGHDINVTCPNNSSSLPPHTISTPAQTTCSQGSPSVHYFQMGLYTSTLRTLVSHRDKHHIRDSAGAIFVV